MSTKRLLPMIGLGVENDICRTNDDCQTGLGCQPDTLSCKPYECSTDSTCVSLYDSSYFCTNQFCQKKSCRSDTDCSAGMHCDGGLCQKALTCSQAAQIYITPTIGVIAQGATRQLKASVFDANGQPITGLSITWTSNAPGIVSVSSSGLAQGGATKGAASIKASLACQSGVFAEQSISNVLSPSAAARVIVMDASTGAVLEGARVFLVLSSVSDLQSAPEQTSDSNGQALFAGSPCSTESCDLHVFLQNYGYVSVLGVKGLNFLVPLTRNPNLQVADGVKGHQNRDAIPTSFRDGDMYIGFTAFSYRRPLADFTPSFAYNEGEVVKSHVKVGSALETDVNFPSGIEEYLSAVPQKDGYFATGEAGPAVLWGFGTYSNLGEDIDHISGCIGDTVDAQCIYNYTSSVDPRSFHGVQKGFALTQRAKVVDVNDRNGDNQKTDYVADLDLFPVFDLQLTQRLSRQAQLTYPQLPAFQDGSCTKAAATVLASYSPLTGLVPLGSIASVDKRTRDDDANCAVGVGNDGKVALSFASRHGAISADAYALISFAGDSMYLGRVLSPTTDFLLPVMSSFGKRKAASADDQFSFSMTITRLNEAPESAVVPAFLDIPNGANFSVDGQQLTLVSEPGSGAQLARFVFKSANSIGSESETWTLYMGASASITKTVLLPSDIRNPAEGTNSYGSYYENAIFQVMKIEGGNDLAARFGFDEASINNLDATLLGSATFVFGQ